MQPGQPRGPRLPLGVWHAGAIACALTLSTLAYATLNRPLTAWREDVDRRADLVRAKLAGGPALRRRHAEKQRELRGLVDRVDVVNKRIPDDPREGEFLADITRLAAQNDIDIEDFRRAKNQSTATHSTVTVELKATGAHRGLCGLIDGVAALPRLAEMTRLDVRRASDGDRHAIEMTYALYYGLASNTAPGSSDHE